MASMGGLRVEIARSLAALSRWEAAWSGARVWSPFAGWTYVTEWLARNRDAQPFVLLVTDAENCLVALAPWCVQRRGVRVLTGVGGDDAGFHDPQVLRAGYEAAVWAEVLSVLKREHRGWDLLTLTLRGDRPGLAQTLRGLGWVEQVSPAWCQRAVIELDDGWDAYWEPRARSFESTLRRIRKLQQLPHRYVEARAGDCDGILDLLFAWHDQRLGELRDWSGVYAFLRGYARRAIATGEASLYGLELEGKLAAIDLLIRTPGAAYGVMRAYDPDLAPLAPGHALTIWLLERLCAEGVTRVDCGAGLHAWKLSFQTSLDPSVRLQAPSTLRGVMRIEWGTMLKEWLRPFPLYDRLRPWLTPTPTRQRPV